MASLKRKVLDSTRDRLCDKGFSAFDALAIGVVITSQYCTKDPHVIRRTDFDDYRLFCRAISALRYRVNPEGGTLHRDLIDHDRVARVRFSRRLGEGAYGRVHLTKIHTKDGRVIECAGKKFEYDQDFGLRYFIREVAFLDRLSKVPFVPRVFLTTFRRVFMTAGDSTLDDIEHPTPPEIRRWLTQLARAISGAHRIGIAHRDLKPQNVVVTRDRKSILLVDWASAIDTTSMQDNELYVTTRYYRPPECVLDSVSFDTWESADVWSFGCVAAELILGKILFPLPDTKALEACATVYAEGIYRVRRIPFLRKVLNPDPTLRPTLREILRWNRWPVQK